MGSNDKLVLPDFPPGPLDTYRKSASFQWKKMKMIMDDVEMLKFKMHIWKTLEDTPLFHDSPFTPDLDTLHHLATLRQKKIRDFNFLPNEEFLRNPLKLTELILALSQYDMSVCLKYFVPFVFFINSIRDLGTEKHIPFIKAAEKQEINGCYALTEVGHGTNAKKMRTTATFDPSTQEFIINTEDFEAAKCWVGSLGKSSTHATVFAQLVTPDGVNQGLHAFIVPIRDPKTMLLYPGVLAGDMGEKIGLNGVDNGFAIFNRYRIPRENLLDRMGTVMPDGKYVSPIKDPRKRFAASLTTLLIGRGGIISMGNCKLAKAVVIAIRYSAVRRQFGPSEEEELPIIEYQLQQWRLFPYLAASYAIKIFGDASSRHLVEFATGQWFGADRKKLVELGAEIHALQSSAKGLATWTAQSGIQECREACGGHGYLKCSGFGALRTDNDANCTYEGDNNVLCQQTSNWLLYLWSRRKDPAKKFSSPLGSVDFMYRQKPTSTKFKATTVNEILQPQGGYAVGPDPSRLIRESIVQLCLQLKPNAVALADVLAPPDFILNSAIGKSDGKLYQNLQAALLQNPGVMERPTWWRDIIGSYKSKL